MAGCSEFAKKCADFANVMQFSPTLFRIRREAVVSKKYSVIGCQNS